MEEWDEAKLFRACRKAVCPRQREESWRHTMATLLWVEEEWRIPRWERGERIPGPVWGLLQAGLRRIGEHDDLVAAIGEIPHRRRALKHARRKIPASQPGRDKAIEAMARDQVRSVNEWLEGMRQRERQRADRRIAKARGEAAARPPRRSKRVALRVVPTSC
jgi:hypothetical protein